MDSAAISSGQNFCRNEMNATGLCNRQSCPLANSRYATVRSIDGRLCLYMKTVERAHMPSRLWEKIKLPLNYEKALADIDSRLVFWPSYMIHRCKQRLTRLTQVAMRIRRLEKEEARLGERLVPRLAPKVKHREQTRERKALAAIKIELQIERELIERLRTGVYGDKQSVPVNINEKVWRKVLRGMEKEGEAQGDKDLDKGIEEELDELEEEEREAEVEYVSDDEVEESDLEEFEDWLNNEDEYGSRTEYSDDDEEGSGSGDSGDESPNEKDFTTPKPGSKKRKKSGSWKGPGKSKEANKKPRVQIEYEQEMIAPPQEIAYA